MYARHCELVSFAKTEKNNKDVSPLSKAGIFWDIFVHQKDVV